MGEILFWIVSCPDCGVHIQENIDMVEDEMVCSCGTKGMPAVGVTRAFFTDFSKESLIKMRNSADAMAEVR